VSELIKILFSPNIFNILLFLLSEGGPYRDKLRDETISFIAFKDKWQSLKLFMLNVNEDKWYMDRKNSVLQSQSN